VLRAGDLNRQVTLQARSTARVAGELAYSWTDVVPVMAAIHPLSGRELELAQAISAEASHQVTIRYRTNISAAMRLVYQGRFFNIASPPMDVEMRHEFLQLLCSEGLNDG
jgi:SPP1 family predicted phage head-tail adaptor